MLLVPVLEATAPTQIRSLALVVADEAPVVAEEEEVTEAMMETSTGLDVAAPLHSSTIKLPFAPPMVSVTVTTLLAVVWVFRAYHISRSNVADRLLLRTRT
jgi:hypothetical protein